MHQKTPQNCETNPGNNLQDKTNEIEMNIPYSYIPLNGL